MSDTKHTPGPWSLSSDQLRGGRYFSISRNHKDSDGVEYEPIDVHEAENGEADARLIAAAPDLLGALKAMLALVKDHPDFQGRDHIGLGIQVNNAIDKAEGRRS